ncbi:DH domain-containing protein [Mycena indigotica]|uniref:DH domain-containing protein n=1 Tax=Mycena indigotica TaxID=2126181 RepID=A0A8H6SAY5_9AGAR|nr:DH domain-containing protein [Mycena indigotica]KAF7294987.1 DH domain-containing protein [Mycena indigotica]
MKAFLSRLHLGGTKEKDRENTALQKEKFPPLRAWPPEAAQRSTSTPNSFKPLPELVPTFTGEAASTNTTPTPPYSSPTPTPTPPRNETSSPLPDATNSPRPDAPPDSAGRSSRKTNTSVANSDVQKKVAFKSPPPTPSNLDREATSSPTVPLKTSVSRFQATHGKEPRGSTSTGASSSKTDLASSAKTAVKSTSTRSTSPYLNKTGDVGSSQSLRSGTPYSSMSNATSGSRILAATSWSEVTEEDLVSHLGSRERTRQEVLFEIISSEERYVQELAKMKDTFIDPMLHPFSAPTPQLSSTPNLDYDYYRTDSPVESNDHLPPIAARFMSPSPTVMQSSNQSHKDTPNIDGESLDTDEEDEGGDQLGRGFANRQGQLAKQNHPRSPYRSNGTKKTVPFPSRSHHSLPPPPRNQPNGSTHSLNRQTSVVDRERERNYSQGQASKTSTPKPGMLRKLKKSQTTNDSIFGESVAPHQLPEDLRICLEVVDSGVFEGHKRLSEALKKRYDDQFPLVRSLADVFVSNSDIFHGYATYVLHLERALEQVDDALSNVSTKKPKKQDVAEWQKVCKFVQKLEESASEKGETGLAITLSKPFQRLLKYPLLFQNLLFHTDPSTFEYESTLQMVAEVETIVRSIEDEKIQKEERDKTRDVFARIEGLDKVKQLALPKPSRVLVEERQCAPNGSSLSPPKSSSPPPVLTNKNVRGKSSFKRLSDVLHSGSGIGGKKDLWLVVFNDVVLQCQRTGTTSLPLVSSTYSRTNSLPELQGRSKYATTGRRNSHTKPRNLYKFLKIETWAIGDVIQPNQGVVSMEDVARSRTQVHQPRIVPMPDDDEDGGDSDDSDRKSKMSFSYWGADKITVQKPVIKPRGGAPAVRRGGGSGSAYGRESSANAKFGTRLVSGDSSPNARPASRRTQAMPTSRRPADDSNVNYTAKSTTTPVRPEWNTSTKSQSPAPSSNVAKRTRNISLTSPSSSSTRLVPAKGVSSPAPSEDSGVGLYRQMMAQDPSLNQS